MFIHEYGNKEDPLVLLLAPMMLSGENLYQLMHLYFTDNYHFIAPDFPHCGYMAAHLKEYAEEVEAFIRRRQDVLG